MMLPVRKWSVFMWMGLALLANGLTAQPAGRDKSDRSIFHANRFESIYKPLRQEFTGVFGQDTGSWFVIRTSGIRVSQPANIHKVQGKNWHRGTVTSFTGENRILKTEPAPADMVDTVNFGNGPRRMLDSLSSAGWTLYRAEGKFMYLEDSTAAHSGRMKGIFKVYFLYNDMNYQVSPVPEKLWLLEPALVFTGTWNPYNSAEAWLPFFWSSLDPVELPDGGHLLPDFRVGANGQIAPGKWIFFTPDATKPGVDW